MSGLSTFFFSLGILAAMALVYAFGVTGWVIGVFMLASGWISLLVFGWADASVLVVDLVAALLAMALALWWSWRDQAWVQRIRKDRDETSQIHQQVQAAVGALREKILSKAGDVDRGMKQYELVKRLAEALSWKEMAPSLERALKHFFRVDAWALYLADAKGDLRLMQRRGALPEPRPEDLSKKEPFLHTFIAQTGLDQGRQVWALGMPLWRLHERIGLLLMRVPDIAADQQGALLAEAAAFSVQLIFAMAKAKLYRELDERSRTDGLTGLTRRGPFEERIKEEVARAQSFRSTFSVLMIDIDHFKRLNDTYGHQMGDEVLKTVSQRLREGLYETDFIARYGGEEFVCLLPRSEPAGLRIKADQLRERVGGQAFVIGLEAIQVTISVGIAHFPQDGRTAEAVMAAADRALYAAKSAGRNCVVEAAAVP
jgi:diguanylate cyclase (GGDEF)-like protein